MVGAGVVVLVAVVEVVDVVAVAGSGIFKKTCLCNVYFLIPHIHIYMSRTGVCRVYQFFLFFIHNIDCGYSAGEATLTCTNIQFF